MHEGEVETFVALKVTEKVIEDKGQYTRAYREKVAEGEVDVPERTKSEIF